MNRTTMVSGPAAPLDAFVSRVGHHEIWLLDNGLYRLDFMSATLDRITLGWTPEHINILPLHDRLVLDVPGANAIRFHDPGARAVLHTVTLPR